MTESIDVLAFSPHPDDAELGCGGSLSIAAGHGLRVAIADLSAGERSSRGTPGRRGGEAAEAAALLGLAERYCMRLPDTEIGASAEHRLAAVSLIREVRPRLVLSPYWEDRHPDHVSSSTLVSEACFYAGVANVGSGPVHRPQAVIYYPIHQPVAPSFVVDITSVWELKKQVLATYSSQFDGGDGQETALSGPEFMRSVEARAIWFGAMIGAAQGEAFVTRGPIGLAQLPGLDRPSAPPGGLPPYATY